ncbi:galactose-binding domain-like protein [Lactarius deliciosus]|nr:galactose-binding domain-like protein [Lactarius deliciosus]
MDPEPNSNASQIVGSNTENLFAVIDRENVHGLNLTVPEDAKETIKPWDERESTAKSADSNVDDQLIIHVPFAQNVRIKSVLLKLGRGDSTPRRMRIYANRAKHHISLLEGETGVTEYPLRAATFASINSLSLFFVSILNIPLSCSPNRPITEAETRTIRKEGTNKLEIPAATAADAPLVDRLREKGAAQQPTAK